MTTHNMEQQSTKRELATFAGGCFWCMVTPFEEQPGIHGIISGYMGGHTANPSYEQVKSGETGHAEVVQITYNPDVFPYERLLKLYWQQIDPTDAGGQFQDRGSQYRTAIFYHNERQKEAAEESRQAIENSGRFMDPIVTEIVEATVFYQAEDYQQDFHKKDPAYYKEDRKQSGRDTFIQEYWK
ncbi:methionine sulfoxide reductase A [Paenibacillus swuensis]|uniref:Peptide methionine sulfoxide reductase MsrA n=1 Tax=Paenibacillus swuensis TaxID=1178515 RepID=A0A172TK97_9BACL|nr:peptide-methionine (S)-S-oxide reductase MsrA [Paenibacillus swuensis]ANE47237.1 methionine sulfoxide reductase A [Paenibacillus swuensis]